ncbi:hypothetical protein WJX79_003993 [Trebouxia sp. C0005]
MQPPRAFQHSLQANAGLVKRLSHTHTFKGHSSTVNALDWSSDGEVLLSGSDDCRVKLWSAESGKAVQSFDSGHTSSIYVTKFMPNTGNEQIITSAADRQVRLVNLQRSAVKPYTFHHGRVKALVPLDPFMFISGSDDGTVRHYDTREPASANSIPGMRTGDVLADQRHERTPRGRAKVSINAVAVDSMRPYLFVTGSSDPLMRLYDRRMSPQRGHTQSPSGRSWPQWVSCFVPTGLKTDTMQPRTGTDRAPFVTSVKFSGGGDQVIASYSGDNIYSFDCVDHARESEGYCTAQGWSRPNSAFGTRSASRHAVLHASATGTAVSDGHAARQASDQSLPPESRQPQATSAIRTDEVAQPASMDSSSIRTGEPDVEGGFSCEQADLPAASSGLSGLSVPVTVDGTRHGPSVEREGLPGKGTGQLAERLPSAPRPPLPFHPIRRSARLHKSAGNAPGTATVADGDGLEVGDTPAGSAQNDVKAEAAGPCTRHSCKRKLAELSESAGPARLEQPTASTGTSRPVPLAHRGTSMQASQAGETVPLAPPDFLRLQYSTDPPSNGPSSSPVGGSVRAAAHGPSRAARSSPEDDSASGPGPSADRHLTDYSRDGQMQLHSSHDAQLIGVVDSFVGAIVQEGSDDDGDGEVVEERGMFRQCYKGHCNLSLNKGVCLLGSRDEYVASGSDDGRIFVWDRFNGRLVNMLSSDDQNVSCVAAHPSMPVLASAGSEPVIKLWSPQAESACNLERAEAIMSHNAQELAEGNVPHVCKMQVKDALGSWKDVHLGPNEVAVMFGQTATQASAGLFRPATYRVVGELYSSCHGNQVHTGRQSVAYHLNARPSAVLNFHDILEDAGHCVPDRYTQPVCMKDLLQRFDTVLTPPSMFKSAAARSIQLGTIDAAAAKKKRKRQVTPVSSPVTRSGRVRRSTAGLLGEPAHAKSSYANEVQKTGDFAAMVQAMRVYLTVDGNTSCPTDFLPVGISHYQTMNTTWFRAHPMAPCCRIFESYCESMGLELMHVRFLRQSGLRVQGSELLMDLKLAEDETLAMLPVQPNTAEEVAPNDND